MPAGSRAKLPSFLTLAGREREEFLRSLGVTEIDDTNLYNLLCSFAAQRRSPRVSVAEFLASVAGWAKARRKPNLMGGAARSALRRLCVALERNGYAVTQDDGAAIVLLEGDRRAGQGERAVAEIEKLYERMEAVPTEPYPDLTRVPVPSTALRSQNALDFGKAVLAAHKDSTSVLRLAFADESSILIIPSVLPRLLEIARRRLHYYIKNSPALSSFVVTELRKVPQFRHILDQQRLFGYLDQRQETHPLFWVYLGLATARCRSDEDLLEGKLREGRTALYQSAVLVSAWWQHEYEGEQAEKQRETDEAMVTGWVERSGRGFTLEEMGDIADEAGRPLRDKYPEISAFLERFLDRLRAEGDAVGKVPLIVSFGDLWMHRSSVLPQLEDEIRAASEFCRRLVEAEWKQKLDHGGSKDPVLHSDRAFAAWLADTVKTRCGHLARMLEHPLLVHRLITELAAESPALIRRHGEIFVSLEEPAFRRTDLLLALEREAILIHLISGMSFLRRFLLRRRFRLKRAAAPARARRAPGRPAVQTRAGERQAAPVESGDTLAGEPQIVKVPQPRRKRPQLYFVGPSGRKEPKNIDAAVDKLKEAMTKRPGRAR